MTYGTDRENRVDMTIVGLARARPNNNYFVQLTLLWTFHGFVMADTSQAVISIPLCIQATHNHAMFTTAEAIHKNSCTNTGNEVA